MEHVRPAELEGAVERARARADRTGELRVVVSGSFATPVSDELAVFAQRILTDGSYAQAVARVGEEDPDLADI